MADHSPADIAERQVPLHSSSTQLASSLSPAPLSTSSSEPPLPPLPLEDVSTASEGPVFQFADPAQILRGHQRDLTQISHLHNLLLDVFHPPPTLSFPIPSHLTNALTRLFATLSRGSTLDALSKLIYLGLTFGLASQTVGEEYVDVLPYAARRGRFPTLRRRWAVIGMIVGGPIVWRGLISSLRRRRSTSVATSPDSTSGALDRRTRTIRRTLLDLISSPFVSALPELWFAWFLFQGRNVSWEKAVGGMRYITALPANASTPRPTYEPLGILLLLPVLTRLISGWRERANAARVRQEENSGAIEGGARGGQNRGGNGTNGRDGRIEDRTEKQGFMIDGKKARLEVIGTEESDPEGITSAGPPATIDSTASSAVPDTASKETDFSPDDLRTILSEESFAHPDRQCPLCLSSRGSTKAASVDGSSSGGTVITECGHVFCGVCIEGWAVEKLECPLCRQEIRMERLIPVYNL